MNPRETIKYFCLENNIQHYIINDDLSVDVTQDVIIRKMGRELPIQFNKIYGDFNISGFNLNTLKGSPRIVRGFFDCSYNSLTTLKYAPKEVLKHFDCSYNILNSLKYSPDEVYDILANHNNLTTLDYITSKIKGSIMINHNFITSLIGCPEVLSGSLHCSFNQLTSMDGAPKIIHGNVSCSNNQIKSFNNEWICGNEIDISYNPVESLNGLPICNKLWCEESIMIKFVQDLFNIGYTPNTIYTKNKEILTRLQVEYRLYTIKNIINHVVS